MPRPLKPIKRLNPDTLCPPTTSSLLLGRWAPSSAQRDHDSAVARCFYSFFGWYLPLQLPPLSLPLGRWARSSAQRDHGRAVAPCFCSFFWLVLPPTLLGRRAPSSAQRDHDRPLHSVFFFFSVGTSPGNCHISVG